jgi:hypothetical protein
MFKRSSGLQRFWIRSCLLVTALLLAELGAATVSTAQASEKDDVKTLLQLENGMAQAWVQRDAQTLELGSAHQIQRRTQASRHPWQSSIPPETMLYHNAHE